MLLPPACLHCCHWTPLSSDALMFSPPTSCLLPQRYAGGGGGYGGGQRRESSAERRARIAQWNQEMGGGGSGYSAGPAPAADAGYSAGPAPAAGGYQQYGQQAGYGQQQDGGAAGGYQAQQYAQPAAQPAYQQQQQYAPMPTAPPSHGVTGSNTVRGGQGSCVAKQRRLSGLAPIVCLQVVACTHAYREGTVIASCARACGPPGTCCIMQTAHASRCY